MNTTYFKAGNDATGHYLEAFTENEFGDIINTKRTYCPLIQHYDNGKLFFLQYNDNMELLYDVCNYLNFSIAESSDKTRAFKAKTLRNYICFMELSGYDYTDLKDADIVTEVCNFFTGENFRDSERIIRSKLTINNYISVIREFARFKRTKSDILDKRVSFKIQSEDPFNFKPKIYRSSLKSNPHANDTQMPYISPEEFTTLRDIAKGKKDYQAVILMHLMYFYGFRIGTCLGLTEEDFVIRKKNYEPSPTILLRNRLSDKPFQYVKNVGHPKSPKDYNGKSYPHIKAIITPSFYITITEFIEKIKNDAISKGIRDRSHADTVNKSYERGDNHYIFINQYGWPLSQQAWNKRLKQYFIAAHIPIDIDVRKDNLNHRFRHGCAIYYLRLADKEHRMTIEQVADLLKNSIPATYKYLKMTIDDEFVLKQKFQDELLKEIPALF